MNDKKSLEEVIKTKPMISEALKEHFKKMFDFELLRFVFNNRENILDSFDQNVSLFKEIKDKEEHMEILEWASNYMDDYFRKEKQ